MKIEFFSLVFILVIAEHAHCADKVTMEKILREIDDYFRSTKDNKKDTDKKEMKEKYSSNHVNDALRELEKALDEESKKRQEKKEVSSKSDEESKKTVAKQDEELEKLLTDIIAREENSSGSEKKPLTDEEIIDAEYKKFKTENDASAKRSMDDDKVLDYEKMMKKSTDDEECKDLMDDKSCSRMVKKGYCAIYARQLKKRCKRSCKFCCGDHSFKCKLLQQVSSKTRERMCKSEKLYDSLNINCPKTCGFCGKMPTETPCTRSTYGCCWDGSIAQDHVGTMTDGCPACEDHRLPIFCKRFMNHCGDKLTLTGNQIRGLCPKTCRLCGVHKRCQDKPHLHDSCFALKHTDQYGTSPCILNYNLMKYNCPKTCNICQKSTVECGKTRFGCCDDGVTIARSFHKENCKECNDSPNPELKCQFWADHGLCFSRENFMRDVCAGSCEFCTKNK